MNSTKSVRDIVSDPHLYELLRRKEMFSEFIQGTYAEHFKTLGNELAELQVEVESGGKGVKGEVMDVLYMVGQLLNKMHKDGLLEGVSFADHKAKIIGRSPNLKQCKKVSRETEDRVWYLLKKKQ